MDNLYSLMREFLMKRGINAREEKAGSLSFSVNGLNFICDTTDTDPYFLRLQLPRINREDTQIDNLADDLQQLNRSFKVSKIVKGADGSLWVIADIFVYSTENINSVFERLIKAMTDMINDYYNLEKEKGNGTVQA